MWPLSRARLSGGEGVGKVWSERLLFFFGMCVGTHWILLMEKKVV